MTLLFFCNLFYQPYLIPFHKHLARKQCHQIPMAAYGQVIFSPCVLLECSGDHTWRWELCWAMDVLQAPRGSREVSRATRHLSAVTCCNGWRMIIPCLGTWCYSSVVPSMCIYNELSKSLKEEGSRGTSPGPGNCRSPFITNEPSVSVTWWWGHIKNPLWACCLHGLSFP